MDPRDYIIALINSFPCLETRLRYTPDTWDSDSLAAQLGVLSSGERHAALFILNVWNPGDAHAEGWVFDAVEAMSCWGRGEREAFIEWCRNPYWP